MKIGPRLSGPRWTGEDDALLLAPIEAKPTGIKSREG